MSNKILLGLTKKGAVLLTMLLIAAPVNASDISFRLNNSEIQFEESNSPLIIEGTTYMPVRLVSELLGKDVVWNAKTQDITIKTGYYSAQLRIGQSFAVVNSKFIELDKAPILKNGTSYIPLRAIGDILGLKIDFNQETREVLIEGNVYEEPEEVKANYSPTEILYQSIDLFGNTFKGHYQGDASLVLIARKEFFPDIYTKAGQLKDIYYKNGEITLIEDPINEELGIGSQIYFVTGKGLERTREPNTDKLPSGELVSTYKVVDERDSKFDKNYKNLSVPNGNIRYIVIEHKIEKLLIAIPISELLQSTYK